MMTTEDIQRLLNLPRDQKAAGFERDTLIAGAALAEAAADNRGMLTALLKAVQLAMIAAALKNDDPRATLDRLLGELSDSTFGMMAFLGKAERNA